MADKAPSFDLDETKHTRHLMTEEEVNVDFRSIVDNGWNSQETQNEDKALLFVGKG